MKALDRWARQSFSAAIGTGVVALVAGVFAAAVGQATDSWLRFFPSALPILVLGRDPRHIELGLWISLAGLPGFAWRRNFAAPTIRDAASSGDVGSAASERGAPPAPISAAAK